ncbi:MAG: CPBP family intramembrane metalloprotease [Erysipelotrichaceae bacterium]|nr:CPBP family intramembrane metalloprotease [Erysipelotrichaceae bacterium]
MKKLGLRNPIVFGILLFFAAVLAAALIAIPIDAFIYHTELSGALSRIVVAMILFVLFFYCFKEDHPFKGWLHCLPVLLVVLWNIWYEKDMGMTSADPILLFAGALAPALFEEIIFRGIIIRKFLDAGKSETYAWLGSALLFSMVHLTNLVGGNVLNTLVQTAYALVIGLLLGAVYLKDRNILSVITSHFLIDLSSRLFEQRSETPIPLLIAFIVLLAVLAAYSYYLMQKKNVSK